MATVALPDVKAQALADLYEDVELRILAKLAAKLKSGKDAPGWQTQKLLELQKVKQSVLGDLNVTTSDALAKLTTLLTERYKGGAATANDVLSAVYYTEDPEGVLVASKELAKLISEASGNLAAVSTNALRDVDDVFRQVIREVSAPGMLLGAETRATAVQDALNKFADKGITGFTDKAGRKWEMRAYVEMATGTAVHRASTQGHLDQLAASGHDLVVVSDHKGECPRCRKWEGKVLSISGVAPAPSPTGTPPWLTKLHASLAAAEAAEVAAKAALDAIKPGAPGYEAVYDEWNAAQKKVNAAKKTVAKYEALEPQDSTKPEFEATVAEARAAGLEHPGCRHRYSAHFPGISPAVEPQGVPEDYEARTQQRAMERQIRAWKRRAAVGDPKADKYVAAWQAKLREHVKTHGLKRRSDREQLRFGKAGQFTALGPKLAPKPAPAAASGAADALSDILGKAKPSPAPALPPTPADDAIKVLQAKLEKVSPTSPWGKKYAADLKKLTELQTAYRAKQVSGGGLDALDDAIKALTAPKPKVVPKVTPPTATPAAPTPLAVSRVPSGGWAGKPAPVKPKAPKPVKPAPGVMNPALLDDWLELAKKRFADFAAKTGNPKNDLTKSLNWNYFTKVATTGDESSLKYLLSNKYIDQSMYDEALGIIHRATNPTAADLAKYTADLQAWDAAQEAFRLDLKAWRVANGIPEPKLRGMDAATRLPAGAEVSWADKNFPRVPPGSGRDALSSYTGSSYRAWNQALRDHKGALPAGSQWAKLTREADAAMVENPADIILNRGTSLAEFLINGSIPTDPMELVGTVQTNHAYTSTAVTGGFGGSIKIHFFVPKGHKLAWAKPFSHFSSENEVILSRGTRYYVHGVEKDSHGTWVVQAEVLTDDVDPNLLGPSDVLPFSK